MTPECLKAVSESAYFLYPAHALAIAFVSLIVGFLGALGVAAAATK